MPPVSKSTAAIARWRERQQQMRSDYEQSRHQLNEAVQGMLLAANAGNTSLAVTFAETALCFDTLANHQANATWELIEALGLPVNRER